jgi:peptide/nickel transport system permease protein
MFLKGQKMRNYIIRRSLQAIPLLFIVSILVFVLIKNTGDPLAYLAARPDVSAADRAYMRRSLGLDDPLYMQYVQWLIGDTWYKRDLDFDGVRETYGDRKGILRGDFGESINHHRPVTAVIGEVVPNTLILGCSALLVQIVLGVAIGTIASLRQYSVTDNLITTISFITFSMPIFMVALLGVYVFAVLFREWGLPYLPVQGMYDPRAASRTLGDLLWHLILPAMSIAAIGTARYARFVRASMLEVMNSDYIRTARAKGLAERRVVFTHMFRNASLPLIALVSLDIPLILSGAVVTETIFSWPGMGRLFIRSLERPDPPILEVFVLLTSVAVVIFQLLADIVYGWADPRIRFD